MLKEIEIIFHKQNDIQEILLLNSNYEFSLRQNLYLKKKHEQIQTDFIKNLVNHSLDHKLMYSENNLGRVICNVKFDKNWSTKKNHKFSSDYF